MLSKEDKEYLLNLAHKTLEDSFEGKETIPERRVVVNNGGLFVTLSKKGNLRGCIGFIQPIDDLSEDVVHASKSAAFNDSRFPPLEKEELEDIKVEISILTVPKMINPKEVVLGKHGLIVEYRGAEGLLLPQVATEHNMSKEEFLGAVCSKAGLPQDMWEREGVKLYGFEAYVFS